MCGLTAKIARYSLIIAACALVFPGKAVDNGLARTPPMGWSTFNQWGGEWDRDLLNLVADSLKSTGLADCGYIYVNCDGHNGGESPYWPAKSGFVNFAQPIAEDLHAKGFKFGVYTSEFANPTQIASDLAAAGADFLKVDAWTTSSSVAGWETLGEALFATGRDILYSTHSSQPGKSNMWRTGGDIFPSWERIMSDYNDNTGQLANAGPGSWADPDMLEAGCRPYTTEILLTYDESRAHFSMWCMMAAPLILGFDVTRTHILNAAPLDEFVKAIAMFANIEVIAVDQDSLGTPGHRIKGQGTLEVWVKELRDGTKAVAFFNRTSSEGTMTISKQELEWGTSSDIYVRDLWLHENQNTFSDSFSKNVASHACEVFRMSTSPIEPTAMKQGKMDRSIAWLEKNGHQVFRNKSGFALVPSEAAPGGIFDMRGRRMARNAAFTGAGAYILHPGEYRGTVSRLIWPAGYLLINQDN